MERTQVLPKYIVVKSVYNNKYLQYGIETDKHLGYKLLDFTGEDVAEPRVKFQVKKANARNGLVHLQCCFNGRYLVRSAEEQNFIVAKADEPEEDQSKWSCTLFQPIFLEDNTIRFRHVQLGRYVCLSPESCCLSVLEGGSVSSDNDRCDVFTIINRGLLTILPKYVAFKGNNGKYLDAGGAPSKNFHVLSMADLGDPNVQFEVFTVGDGSIAIKCLSSGNFLLASENGFICAAVSDYKSNTPYTLFWPIKISENTIALRSMNSNKFCRRYNYDGPYTGTHKDVLLADIESISQDAHLEVHELVLSRDIYDVVFHLEDAKIYNQKILTMATISGDNDSQATNSTELKLSYEDTKTSTWNASLSLTLGIKTKIQTGIPFIVKGRIEISVEFTGSYEWGETKESKNVVEVVHKVAIPPMSSMKVDMLATMGSCNIPFSYTQCDTLTDGTQKIYDVDGGIYTCTNYYNFKYDDHQLPL